MITTKRIERGFADMERVEALALEAFPPEEYFPPSEAISRQERGEMEFWALYDGNEFVGFIVMRCFRDMAYICFLAIESDKRNRGYGSQTLAALNDIYPGKKSIVDFERLDPKAPNIEQRRHRKGFYLRNGYEQTGHYIAYNGMDFEILCRGGDFSIDDYKAMLDALCIENFHAQYLTDADYQ